MAIPNFSNWMRGNLLNSWEGLITQDIDYIVFNKNFTSFVLLEEKNSENAKVNIAQAVIFKFLDEFLSLQNAIPFNGCYLVYALHDGNIYINPQLIRQGKRWSYRVNSLKNEQNISPDVFKNLVCNIQNQLKNNYYKKWWESIVEELVGKLYDCSGNPPDFGTRRERTDYRGTNLTNFCTNMKKIDWIFVNYCTGYFILLEEKPFSNGNYKPDTNEGNLIEKINDVFENSNSLNGRQVKNPKSGIPYKYLGYFLLEFDRNNPDDSQIIWLNNRKISKKDLKNFLNLNSGNARKIAKGYRRKWW